MTAAVQETWDETVAGHPAHHLTVLTSPPPEPTVDEVRAWPGVWDATRTFAGWILYADSAQPAEDTVASARKLGEATGRTVLIQGMVIYQ